MHRPRRLLLSIAAFAVIAVATPAAAFATTRITMSGSTASFPLLELLTAKYSKLQHHKIKFSVLQGGASVGIADVAAGKVDIGDSSRAAEPGIDPSGLDFYPIATYYVCAVTNPSNPISNLTPTQLEQIFEGKVRSWSQVSGATATGTIDVDSRTSVAGVLTTFQTTLLAGGKVGSFASQYAAEGQLQAAVERDPNAIGFLSNYFAKTPGLNAVAYNGVACSDTNAVNGTYPGTAQFWEVTRGLAQGKVLKFIDWIQNSKAALKIVETKWLPPTGSGTSAG
jgi:phosphate transport system substrate-binding protein